LTVVSSSTLTFLYNALGQAVQWTQSGVTYDTLYDASGEMMARFNEASNNWDTAPFRLGHRALGTYDFSSNVTHFLHANALGSGTVITDGTGSVVNEQLFYPWGTLWEDTSQSEFHFAAFDWGYATPGVLPTPNRMYSYGKGRWMTPDPAGLAASDASNPESLNRYAYVGNNPTTLVDPKGLHFFQPCFSVWNCWSGDPNLAGGGGCTVDGITGPCSTLGGNANVPCPNNACTAVNSQGQPVYFQAFAGGGGGYFTYSGAGSLFYSVQAAGTAAALAAQLASAANPTAIEYGGNVYADNQDGVYSYSPLQQGQPCLDSGECDLSIAPTGVPDGDSIIGLYHDHPGTGPGSYDFSVGCTNCDLDNLSAAGYYGFLATQPPSRVLMFNPVVFNNWFYGQGNGPAVCVLQGPLMGGTQCP
jgi:RHS repeat-associated protein